jgi:hypothetical protein
MNGFTTYVNHLKRLTETGEKSRSFRCQLTAALDGEPSRQLHELVPLHTIRKFGAFFTGSKLAARLVNGWLPGRGDAWTVCDPTCGVGDLLAACARKLPLGIDLASTLRLWGSRLSGVDLHEEFIQGAQLRLLLLAMKRCHDQRIPRSCSWFPKIKVGDYANADVCVASATHIVLNPPYTLASAPQDYRCGTGRVSSAAVFSLDILRRMAKGTRLAAILPDVLRTGKNYAIWRSDIEATSLVERITPVGRFDDMADVDVFMLHLIKTSSNKTTSATWWPVTARGEPTIADLFNVSVGTLVPHRDPYKGPVRAYAHARQLPPWGTVRRLKSKRRHPGRVFKPPFVAIRRTSSPADRHRCVGTIILGSRAVLLENHLIALLPKDGQQATCERLLESLRDKRTDNWMNRRIRCRHLTVAAVRELTLWR